MAVAINGRKIEWVCTIHGLKYGIRPTPDPNAKREVGYCDVCQEIGVKDAPQTIRKVKAYVGIRDGKKLVTIRERIKGKMRVGVFAKFVEPKII